MSSTAVAVIIIVVVIVIIAIVAVALVRANRSKRLRQQFGPEYDRAVQANDGKAAAERELRERERKHSGFQLKDLDQQTKDRYAQSWRDIQVQFVEDPATAVRKADTLVAQLVKDRGYPAGSYDEQLSQLSVEHADTLGHLRDAHEISDLSERGEATTEQLRQALVHYRALFADLLGDNPVGGNTAKSVAGTTTATPADPTATEAPATPAADLENTHVYRKGVDDVPVTEGRHAVDAEPAVVEPAVVEPVDAAPVDAGPAVVEPVPVEAATDEPVADEPVVDEPVAGDVADPDAVVAEPVDSTTPRQSGRGRARGAGTRTDAAQ